MFNSIDFSLPPQALGFAPYIENPAAVHGKHCILRSNRDTKTKTTLSGCQTFANDDNTTDDSSPLSDCRMLSC